MKPKLTSPDSWQKIPAITPKKVPTRAGWSKDDPPVITSQTKVTICPSPVYSLRTNTHSPY